TEFRAGDGRLLVAGSVRRARDRVAGGLRQPDFRLGRAGDGAMTLEALPRPETSTDLDALSVANLEISYRVRGRAIRVVRDVSFRVARGESYGLVGESGNGKSTIALAVVRYLARNGRVSAGRIVVEGRDVLAMNAGQLREFR